MAKEKKISIGFIDRQMGNCYEYKDVCNMDDLGEVVLKFKYPTLKDVREIVEEVVSCTFASGVDFSPVDKEFSFRRAVVKRVTNVSLPEDEEHQWKILMYSGTVCDQVFYKYHGIIEMVRDLVNEAVRYQSMVNVYSMSKKIDEAIGAINSMTDSMSGVFDGLPDGSMNDILSNLASNNFNEEEFAKAIMRAGG